MMSSDGIECDGCGEVFTHFPFGRLRRCCSSKCVKLAASIELTKKNRDVRAATRTVKCARPGCENMIVKVNPAHVYCCLKCSNHKRRPVVKVPHTDIHETCIEPPNRERNSRNEIVTQFSREGIGPVEFEDIDEMFLPRHAKSKCFQGCKLCENYKQFKQAVLSRRKKLRKRSVVSNQRSQETLFLKGVINEQLNQIDRVGN